jgi:phycocyanin-associated rod linker protein
MASLAVAQRLGIEPYSDSAPVEMRPNGTAEEAEVIIRAVYRQVLGNAMARIRRSSSEYLIPYEQLSWKLQQINNQGWTVTSVTPA